MLVPLLIAAGVGYLLGALPFGYLVARAKGVNIFEVGSKNPGATNVRRVLGHGPGNLVLLLDALKGAAAVGLFPLLHRVGPEYCPFDAGGLEILQTTGLVAAILGHSFSCFTGFKGGKSVATGAGGFLVLFPAGMGIGLAVFGLTVALGRMISLGSMLGAAAVAISAVALRESVLVTSVAAVVALFVILRHRANIARILAGTESKIGAKKNAAGPGTPPTTQS
jgi:glycerol-3-phosphate acyltransferase PlsY